MSFGFSRVIPESIARRDMKTVTDPKRCFAARRQLIPGGVNSPVRAFRSVGGNPRFIARGEGSRLFDVDGNEYIDYVGSWGPLLLGHRHAAGDRAPSREALEIGTSFGAPTEREDRTGRGDLRTPCRRSRWCGW